MINKTLAIIYLVSVAYCLICGTIFMFIRFYNYLKERKVI
jgi:hypothetical protein